MKQVFSFSIAGLVGGLAVLLGQWLGKGSDFDYNKQSNTSGFAKNVNATNTGHGGFGIADFSEAAKRSMPSVVSISSIEEFQAQNEYEQRFYDYFGRPAPRKSSGSGVIISKDGYIATNNHVIQGATTMTVTLNDNRQLKAILVGSDPNTDLAVIKIEASGLQPIEFANSDDTEVGNWVLAVGNPFSLTSTATAGIISAKGRSLDIIQSRGGGIESFIQTDAAINPGNSGGALVSVNGSLIGINTAIYSETGSYAGYGFAVPSNLVKKVAADLIEYGKVERAGLGVNIEEVNPETVKEYNLGVSEGVYVAKPKQNSAAEAAGIKTGDVIVGIDGKKVKTANELQEKIGSRRPGEVVQVTVYRQGSTKDIAVKLKSLDFSKG